MRSHIFTGAPNFISLRSAEVILSEVRPVKLNVDALRCVNVFLDELLFNILNAARSLQTDRLRDGLLKVLPTSLGKSALLEANVELRAYWERTKTTPTEADIQADNQNFNVQWAFEVSLQTHASGVLASRRYFTLISSCA